MVTVGRRGRGRLEMESEERMCKRELLVERRRSVGAQLLICRCCKVPCNRPIRDEEKRAGRSMRRIRFRCGRAVCLTLIFFWPCTGSARAHGEQTARNSQVSAS